MAAEGGQNTLRFSISWTRILPDQSGKVNEEGVNFYKDVLLECKKYGITPNVTLLHYDIPAWLEDMGGYRNPIFAGLLKMSSAVPSPSMSTACALSAARICSAPRVCQLRKFLSPSASTTKAISRGFSKNRPAPPPANTVSSAAPPSNPPPQKKRTCHRVRFFSVIVWKQGLELIPKLTMNGNKFTPDNNGTSKLKQGHIVDSFLFRIEPGVYGNGWKKSE